MSKTHDQIFTYTSGGGRVSHCQVTIYQRPGELPLLLLSERADNPGPSITNTIEQAASAAWRDLLPRAEGVRVVEHYPAEPVLEQPESFDLVTFAVEELYRLAEPTWHPLSAAEIATLLGRDTALHGLAERVYVGERGPDGTARLYVEEGGQRRPLPHVVYHSPDGLEFGFGGSGPADTALSILADYFGEQPTAAALRQGAPRCWALHQAFKWRFIASAPPAGFRLPASAITGWLEEHGRGSKWVSV